MNSVRRRPSALSLLLARCLLLLLLLLLLLFLPPAITVPYPSQPPTTRTPPNRKQRGHCLHARVSPGAASKMPKSVRFGGAPDADLSNQSLEPHDRSVGASTLNANSFISRRSFDPRAGALGSPERPVPLSTAASTPHQQRESRTWREWLKRTRLLMRTSCKVRSSCVRARKGAVNGQSIFDVPHEWPRDADAAPHRRLAPPSARTPPRWSSRCWCLWRWWWRGRWASGPPAADTRSSCTAPPRAWPRPQRSRWKCASRQQ